MWAHAPPAKDEPIQVSTPQVDSAAGERASGHPSARRRSGVEEAPSRSARRARNELARGRRAPSKTASRARWASEQEVLDRRVVIVRRSAVLSSDFALTLAACCGAEAVDPKNGGSAGTGSGSEGGTGDPSGGSSGSSGGSAGSSAPARAGRERRKRRKRRKRRDSSGGAMGGAAGEDDLVSCDHRQVLCKSTEPTCPEMQVARVENGCWGPASRSSSAPARAPTSARTKRPTRAGASSTAALYVR